MASIKQNVLDVIAERHTTKAAVERAAGLANGTINAWSDKSEPRKTTLEQIAAVLGVNVNVFYGTEKEAATNGSRIDLDSLSPAKAELFRLLMETPDDQVSAILQMLRSLLP